MNLTEKKWFRVAWTVFMLSYLVMIVFVHPAHAGCGWTDGPNEFVAADMAIGLGGVAAIVALVFPPIGVAAVLMGGLGVGYHAVLMMSGC